MFHYANYIYAVYRERSFSKAADKLFITQPALSIMIRKAEEGLGLPIFDRSHNPIGLTPFGVEYVQALEEIHGIEQRLREMVEKTCTLQQGHLSIGSSNLCVDYFVTRHLVQFHRQYPNVDLIVRNLNTLDAKHLLDLGELDFVITNRPYDNKKYVQKVCFRECLLLVVPSDFEVNKGLEAHCLAPDELGDAVFSLPRRRTVSLSLFAQVPFILLSSQNYLRQYTDFLFRERNISPTILLELEQSATSYNFANLGMGATILSNRLIQNNADTTKLCFYKIDSDHADRDTFLSFRSGVYFSDAMRRFAELFLEAYPVAADDEFMENLPSAGPSAGH